MLVNYGKVTKKVPLPVVIHLNQAVAPLSNHTGRNLYLFKLKTKDATKT